MPLPHELQRSSDQIISGKKKEFVLFATKTIKQNKKKKKECFYYELFKTVSLLRSPEALFLLLAFQCKLNKTNKIILYIFVQRYKQTSNEMYRKEIRITKCKMHCRKYSTSDLEDCGLCSAV